MKAALVTFQLCLDLKDLSSALVSLALYSSFCSIFRAFANSAAQPGAEPQGTHVVTCGSKTFSLGNIEALSSVYGLQLSNNAPALIAGLGVCLGPA